jgi:hypothetical protein
VIDLLRGVELDKMRGVQTEVSSRFDVAASTMFQRPPPVGRAIVESTERSLQFGQIVENLNLAKSTGARVA